MQKRFYELLEGKSVAIIGGHDATLDQSAFDRDVVIRVNDHYKRQGGRVDVLFTAVSKSAPAKGEHVPLVYCRIPYAEHHLGSSAVFAWSNDRTIKKRSDYYSEWINTFRHELNTNAFTGIYAIKWATLFPVKEIFITGFSFYRLDNGDFMPQIGSHHIPPQINWLKWLWHTDLRVEVDKGLFDILELQKYDRCVRVPGDLIGDRF